jgi:hypothetical protein
MTSECGLIIPAVEPRTPPPACPPQLPTSRAVVGYPQLLIYLGSAGPATPSGAPWAAPRPPTGPNADGHGNSTPTRSRNSSPVTKPERRCTSWVPGSASNGEQSATSSIDTRCPCGGAGCPRPGRRRHPPLRPRLVTGTGRRTPQRRPHHRPDKTTGTRHPYPRHPRTTTIMNGAVRSTVDVVGRPLGPGPETGPNCSRWRYARHPATLNHVDRS